MQHASRHVAEVGELRRHARTMWTNGIAMLRVSTSGGAAGYLVWQAIAMLEHADRSPTRDATYARPDAGLLRGHGAVASELLWMLWSSIAGETHEGVSIDNARRLAMLTRVDASLRAVIESLGDDWDRGLAMKYRALVDQRIDRIARVIARVDIDSIAASIPAPAASLPLRAIANELHRWSVARDLAATPVPADAIEAAIHRAIASEAHLERARLLYLVRVELDARATATFDPAVRVRLSGLVARAKALAAREDVQDVEVAQLVTEVLHAAV